MRATREHWFCTWVEFLLRAFGARLTASHRLLSDNHKTNKIVSGMNFLHLAKPPVLHNDLKARYLSFFSSSLPSDLPHCEFNDPGCYWVKVFSSGKLNCNLASLNPN